MNTVVFSLIIASINAFFVLIFDNNSENENKNKTARYFQVMLISFICIYVGMVYLYNDNPSFIFDKGDAPF